ncbi:hypothetical protein Agabi119p4_9370 [Agaricus bisporus var. burnettii]|uniref:Anaphase-promoting complex subunit 4 WD40 domain-containing protein n=1 Tax=Agaricus bisporus var. burnettii TaxID=192524 RepID=A0A8H7EWK6_AGABI|nr:hypothetical protein Agabi119p4_9370 [Agaricus bisporus var. burnettii]
MQQTGLIQHAHDDLITDTAYDFYGLRLATCGLDQRIKIWQLDESNGSWRVQDEWKAHEAPVSKIHWAHPEFGSVIASCSFDRTAKVWEQASANALLDTQQFPNATADGGVSSQPVSRWLERNVMAESKGTVRDVEFAPHYFGLKLATISTDNVLRVYECVDQSSLTTWQLLLDIDVLNLPTTSSTPTFHSSRQHTIALSTPTQTTATLDLKMSNNFADHAQALSQGLAQNAALNNQAAASRHTINNREADGGWCLSWCKDRYWGEILAVGAATSGVIKIVQLTPSRRHITLLTLDPSPSLASSASIPPTPSITQATNTSNINNISANLPAPGHTTSPLQPFATPTAATASSSLIPAPPSQGPSAERNKEATKSAITSLSWAPSCGRSYHLIATGSRDGTVHIWRVQPGEELDSVGPLTDDGPDLGKDTSETDESRWSVIGVSKVEHKSSVSRVEWNITGTILSSAGNDGRIRLWKAGPEGQWKSAGTIGVEQVEESEADSQRDVDMER